MAKSSNLTKDLITAIGAAVMRWQDVTARYDEAVGARLDLSTSERQCLACLVHGARPARDIASATHLSRAAVTTLVDRLEARGLVRRAADTADRRQVLVSMTQKAKRLTGQFYAAIAAEGAELLARYSREELATILNFIEAAVVLQQRHMGFLEDGE
jgi:DNA-binding MarR family transcriptional regulator